MENIGMSAVIKEAERVYNMKRDYIVPAEKIEIKEVINAEDGKSALKLSFIGDKDAALYGLTRNAHEQVGNKLGIPASYYNRMLDGGKVGLLADNINAWMPTYREEDRRFLLRLLDGKVRGFLSSRYNCLDNYQLLQFVKQKAVMEGAEEFQAVITDTNLYVKLVLPRIKGDIGVGDIVQQGIVIKNSEVGRGAVSITPFFLRLRCLNGMITSTPFRAVHLGGDRQEGDFWSSQSRQYESAYIFSRVNDMMSACLNGQLLDAYLTECRAAQEVRLDRPVEEITNLGAAYMIPKPDIKEITDRYINGMDASLFGLVNTMTDYAKTKPIDDQIDLETKAYKIMINVSKAKARDIVINDGGSI